MTDSKSTKAMNKAALEKGVNRDEYIANMSLWENVRDVDRGFTKKITGKSYSGDSPNPTYIIQKITEQLGPIGQKWGFRIVKEQIVETVPHVVMVSADRGEIVFEKMHYVEIDFWQIDERQNRSSFSACGGTKLLYKSKRGDWIADEDAPKKSLTDAYVKAASWLGVCADLFLGLFDDRYGEMPTPHQYGGGVQPDGLPTPTPTGGGNTSPFGPK